MPNVDCRQRRIQMKTPRGSGTADDASMTSEASMSLTSEARAHVETRPEMAGQRRPRRTTSKCHSLLTTHYSRAPHHQRPRRDYGIDRWLTGAALLAGAAQAADWPRLGGAWGSVLHGLVLREAAGAGRGLSHLAFRHRRRWRARRTR